MWAQIINTVLGVWLMAAPELLGFSSQPSINGYITGPLIITFSVIAYWEATRSLRYWNMPIALWLLIAPWLLQYDAWQPILSDSAVGFLVLSLSLVKGQIKNRYGGGWKSLWQSNPAHSGS